MIIEDNKSRSFVLNGVTDPDILALLSRRPCMPQGISAGLGLHIGEMTRRLQALADILPTIGPNGWVRFAPGMQSADVETTPTRGWHILCS